MVRIRTGWVLALIITVGAGACSSGSTKTVSKRHSATTTTRRKSRHSATTSSTSKAPISTTVAPPSSTTSLSLPPPSSVPPPTDTCGPRAASIYAAVQGGGLGAVPLDKYTISECRVATSNQIWSAVTLVPNPGSGVQQLTVALERVGALWRVHAYGPIPVACDAPPPVPTELRLGC